MNIQVPFGQPFLAPPGPHIRWIEEAHRAIAHQCANLGSCGFTLQEAQVRQLNLIVRDILLETRWLGGLDITVYDG
jgi:hypothetical protein